MKHKTFFLIFIIGMFTLFTASGQDIGLVKRANTFVIKGHLIAKVKKDFRGVFYKKEFIGTPIFDLISRLDVSSIEQKFPKLKRPREHKNEFGEKLIDLTNIFTIDFSSDFDEFKAAKMFYLSGMFDYVEVQVLPNLMYVPDDPKLISQYHLDLINAVEAWDLQKGDTNVVIGIIDTGIDTDHPEVIGRVKHNYDDPIDGIDNDNDGYVDNFSGWDTGSKDNDPEVWGDHGNQVTGCASINTDNASDVAAIGFNTMILPVKISNDSGFLIGAYDGIVYAANHGADIINCSWGAPSSFSQFQQDVINYATNNKGAIVVAAAGNDNSNSYFYPASYDNVVSVGGTDENDKKWISSSSTGSQFNDAIDVVAPAQNIVSIWKGGGSGLIGRGTSFAAPIVSGVLGLIKAEYPSASPQKLCAILKASTDDIYGVAGNEGYLKKLGTGRVNAFKALQPVSTPFLTYYNHKTDDGSNQNLAAGDTVLISVDIKNHLAATNNVSIILRSSDSYTTVLDSISFVSSIGNEEIKTSEVNFKFVISNLVGPNSPVQFSLFITDGQNDFSDAFSIRVNKDYVDITTNNLDLSFNNYGRIGYTFAGAGLGVEYKGSESLIKEMGVLLGISKDNVLSYQDYELLTFDLPKVNSTNSLSISEDAFTASGVLDDSWALQPKGIKVNQTAYAWNSENNQDYVIYEYTVKNPTGDLMENVFLGIFGDWDIGDKNNNIADFESSKDLGYVYEPNGVYGGIKALRTKNVNYYAFDKSGNDGINIKDGFDDNEEYESMSNGVSHSNVSGDVANIISNGPFSIQPGDSIVVAFAILAGNDLNSLKINAQYAELMYEKMRGINISVNNISNVKCYDDENGEIALSVELGFPPYNVKWYHDSDLTLTMADSLMAGSYYIEITDKYDISRIMNFSIAEPSKLSVDVISLENNSCADSKNGNATLDVTGGSGSYYYDWGNPLIPTIESPQLRAGYYELKVSDINGCYDTVFIDIGAPDTLKMFKGIVINDTNNVCDGELTVVSSGGISPYQYAFSGGFYQPDNTFNDLCKGDYEITLEDANGCELTQTFEIEAPESIDSTNSTNNIVSEFQFFPIPAHDYITAQFKLIDIDELKMSVVDVNGKLIQRIENIQSASDSYKVILNVSQFKSGNYFFNISNSKGLTCNQFQVYH